MLSIFKYSGVTSKVRVMFGKMLGSDDYRELSAKKSVHDIAAFLKQQPYYSPVLKNINEGTIHRSELEKVLRRSLIRDYMKLLKFIKGDIKAFLKLALLRYEIENLKMLLRVLNTENDTHIAMDSLLFLKKYDTVNIEKLAASRNVPEFIQNLKGSIYYNVLLPFLQSSQLLNLFSVEMSLDLYFFTMMWKQKDKLLKGDDRKTVKASMGSEIDILNIMWIYRSKKYYHIPKEIIYSYLIPYRHSITKNQIISMVEAADTETLMNIIGQTKYSSIFMNDNNHYFEKNYAYFIYNLNRKNLRSNYFSISPILAYLHLKELEIQNIISIIEGVRYGLSQEDIRRYIVGI